MNQLINSLQFRLYVSFALLIVAVVVLAGVILTQFEALDSGFDIAEIISEQRADAYLLASLARRYEAFYDDEPARVNIQNSMEEVMGEFEEALELYHEGGITEEGEEVSAIDNPNLEPIHDRLDEAWNDYEAILTEFIAADSETRIELLPRIESQSVTVFTFADRLLSGIDLLFDQQIETSNNIAITIGVLSAIVMIFAVYNIITIVRAVHRITNSAQVFARGDFSASVEPENLIEINAVASVLNNMAARINELISNLEARTEDAEKAREIAEQANEVKSAFLANMSHELRTPLNSVINFTKFVAKGVMGPVNERQQETLNKVINSGQHLLQLINDVLDISKIESNSMTLFIEDDINLNEIINMAVDQGRSHIGEKPIEVKLDVPPNLPLLTGDRKRIMQIIFNVVSNACKYTEQGSVTITLQLANDDEVIISVRDTGPGIDPAEHELIFETFKQTHQGLRKGEGTGLGLPISKRLAESHGGRLWVESEAGKGATFVIALPLKANTEQTALPMLT